METGPTADKDGAVSHATGPIHERHEENTAHGDGKDDAASSSSSSSSSGPSDVTLDGFEGWARIFYQGRSDRVSTQLHPTNSSTLARDSYLYIEIDPEATQLRIYPSSEEKILVVDPPIELKYFYAARVPGSNAGAALFLREDGRTYQRYIFRFEFRNDKVVQPAARLYQLARCSKAVKTAQRNWAVRKKFGVDKMMRQDADADESIREEEKKSQEIMAAYNGVVEDLNREGLLSADAFVGLVNSAVTKEGGRARRVHPFGTSWGAGYEDVKRDDEDEGGSDWSDETDGQYSDDDEESFGPARATEKIEESFERVFGELSKRITKA